MAKEKVPRQARFAVLYLNLKKRLTKRYMLLLLVSLLLINTIFYLFSLWLIDQNPDFLLNDQPLQIMDLMMGYTPEEAFTLAEGYGNTGRWLYVTVSLTLDMIYPIVYGLFLTLCLIFLLENSYPKMVNMLYKGTFIPLLMSLVDFFENVFISTFVASYSLGYRWTWAVYIANFFTQFKWMLAPLIFTLLIVGLITYWANKKNLLKERK